MSWWDSADAFASLYGKTQSRNWRHAMPSILFMNWELLSGVLTDNIVKTCQHSSANAKGSRHVSTAAFSRIFPPPPPELIWWRRMGSKLESGVKFHCAQTSIFYTFLKQFCPPAQSHGNSSILTAVTMKGAGLLLCKLWKWSSHTVCLCALLALLPHPDVYSLTAHSFWTSVFEVSAHSAIMLTVNDYIKE